MGAQCAGQDKWDSGITASCNKGYIKYRAVAAFWENGRVNWPRNNNKTWAGGLQSTTDVTEGLVLAPQIPPTETLHIHGTAVTSVS